MNFPKVVWHETELRRVYRQLIRQDQPINTVNVWYNKTIEGIFYQKRTTKFSDDEIFEMKNMIKYKVEVEIKKAFV